MIRVYPKQHGKSFETERGSWDARQAVTPTVHHAGILFSQSTVGNHIRYLLSWNHAVVMQMFLKATVSTVVVTSLVTWMMQC